MQLRAAAAPARRLTTPGGGCCRCTPGWEYRNARVVVSIPAAAQECRNALGAAKWPAGQCTARIAPAACTRPHPRPPRGTVQTNFSQQRDALHPSLQLCLGPCPQNKCCTMPRQHGMRTPPCTDTRAIHYLHQVSTIRAHAAASQSSLSLPLSLSHTPRLP